MIKFLFYLFASVLLSFSAYATNLPYNHPCYKSFNKGRVAMPAKKSYSKIKLEETTNSVKEDIKSNPEHPNNLRHYFDHTVLKADASHKDIITLVEEAIKYKLKAVCVNSCRIHDVSVYLKEVSKNNSHELLIAAVMGFPLGSNTASAKVSEAKETVSAGAQELDMVINVGYIKDGKWSLVESEIKAIVQAVKVPVKVIIETDLLTKEEIEKASMISAQAGAHFVKTSTGFVPNGKGALLENIELMKKGIRSANLPEDKLVEIKASGGVKTLEQAIGFIKTGVTRLGSSSSIPIMEEAMKKYNVDISELGK